MGKMCKSSQENNLKIERVLAPSDIKTYYKTVIAKTVWYWSTPKQINKCNKLRK